MKRITLLLAFIGMITLQSCSREEDNVDFDTIGSVFEVTRTFTPANNYSSLISYPASINPIFPSDMVLAYRLDGVVNGNDVWKLMPQTFYFPDGTLDFRYDFDFTQYDIDIYMEGFDLATLSNTYKNNQVFRIVIVPAAFTGKSSLNTRDYNAVIQALQIDESKILKIN